MPLLPSSAEKYKVSPTKSDKLPPGPLLEIPGLISETSHVVPFEVLYAHNSLPLEYVDAVKYIVSPTRSSTPDPGVLELYPPVGAYVQISATCHVDPFPVVWLMNDGPMLT